MTSIREIAESALDALVFGKSIRLTEAGMTDVCRLARYALAAEKVIDAADRLESCGLAPEDLSAALTHPALLADAKAEGIG